MNFAQIFTQVVPAQTWTINHSYTNVPITSVVTIIDGVATQILPMSVKAVSTTELLVEFTKPYSGTVRLYGNVADIHPIGAQAIDPVFAYPTVFYAGASTIDTTVDGFTAPFTVTRTGDTPAATVAWSMVRLPSNDGTYGAYDGDAPFNDAGTLTFAIGATSAVVHVTFTPGGTYLLPYSVAITISSPSVGSIGEAVGTIDFI
jgi:hypothetical protein